jgi:MFS family permease
MGLIGMFFSLIGSLIGLVFGLIGTFFGLFFSLLGGLLAAPVIIALVIVGLLLWHPLLWIGLGLGGYLLYRLARRKGYVEIRRIGPSRKP